jgi:hypothetical protein
MKSWVLITAGFLMVNPLFSNAKSIGHEDVAPILYNTSFKINPLQTKNEISENNLIENNPVEINKITHKIWENIAFFPDLEIGRIEFLIEFLPDGNIFSIKMLASSGKLILSDIVERAIVKSQPLPVSGNALTFKNYRKIRLGFNFIEWTSSPTSTMKPLPLTRKGRGFHKTKAVSFLALS